MHIYLRVLPVKTEMDFRDKCQKNKNYIPEITTLLQYWPMLEIFDRIALEVNYLKNDSYCFIATILNIEWKM